MSEHYFTNKPTSKSEITEISTQINHVPFRFQTDHSVFSRQGIDFGTRLLLETIQVPDGIKNILDVGCGYGPIGIFLAKTNPSALVQLVDTNERAVQLSKKNAILNEVTNTSIYTSDLFSNVKETSFSLIVSNPPIRAGKSVIYSLFEKSASYLDPKGEFWIVIQKKQGGESAFAKLKSIFQTVDIVEKKKGYMIISAKNN